MLNDFLFEIECAEKIGNFKLADALTNRLSRIATADRKVIQKQIEKKFSHQIKDLSYSQSQNKFIISVEAGVSNNIKREIKELADPFVVAFKYSNTKEAHKNIDELMGDSEEFPMGTSEVDPLDKHIKSWDDYSSDHIGLDALDDMEPTEEDLRFTAEHPADEISEDPSDLDALLLQEARKYIQQYMR